MSREAMLGVYWTAITVVCIGIAVTFCEEWDFSPCGCVDFPPSTLVFLTHNQLFMLDVSGSKIIDGNEATPHSRPYMARLLITTGDQRGGCGAFLITENVLLTAAHCQGERITAILGSHNLNYNEASRQEIAVSRMIPHEFYEHGKFHNDIMLLQLERKVMITPEVRPIKFSTDCADIWPGMTCSVAGWGCTFTGGPVSDVLREVDVTIQKICRSEQCYKMRRRTVFCAMGPGIKGVCKGDSGDPLVTRNKLNETLAVGIVSFENTKGCETPKTENVYTNICMFWPWIKSKFNSIAAE